MVPRLIADRSGNGIGYSYTTTVNNDRDARSTGDEPCVEQHIDTISYGSKQVKFQYTPASGSDASLRRRMYIIGGFCTENTQKMTGIQVLGPRPETGSTSPQVLKQYSLTVKPEGLTTITERDANGVSSSRSVNFQYETAPASTVPTMTPVAAMTAPIPPVTVPPNQDKGFPGALEQTGDVDGDGFEDLVYYTGSIGAASLVVQLSNGGAPGLPPFQDQIAW